MSFTPSKLKSPKGKLFFSFFLTALVTGFLLTFSFFTDANRKFEKIADEIFRNEMLGNTLNMHYTLAHPENYGITEYSAILPCYSARDREAAVQVTNNYLKLLNKINENKLSEDNRQTHTLLCGSLENTLEGYNFPYYEEPLSPSSGMQSQLPILLAEYTFRTEQDVRDYLSLLDQTDEYFSSLALYEADKKTVGLLQSYSSLEQVIRQCTSLLTLDDLESNTHFLQTTFSERLEPLLDNGIITTESAEYYISLNNRLLSTVMQPAYERLADSLFLLMGDDITSPTGLAGYPQGQEYYSYLIKKSTGSSRTVKEIKELLYPTLKEEYETLQSLIQTYPESVSTWIQMRSDATFPFDNVSDILLNLTTQMHPDFPPLPVGPDTAKESGDHHFPTPAVKTVSPGLAPYCAPAFYLTPPLDDILSNVIYINPLSTTSGLELYTTLAHEGYPGHLYQSVYHNLNLQQNRSHPVRQILWYGGYQEGWALYVEFLSYDYAIALANNQAKTELAHAYELEKHNRSMQLCLYSLIDISIHYDNASYDEIHKVLSSFGIKDPSTTRAVYHYIAEEPANYLKYYLGYLEILSLKEKARNLWQGNYSDYRFHQFFLDWGPSDFDSLENTLS